jgi:MFS family permease
MQAAEGAALLIGALVAGALAEIVGPGNVLWMAIGGALLPLVILAFSPLWALERLEDLRVPA